MRKLVLVSIGVPLCLAQLHLNSSGSISGTLTGDDGTVISGAYVQLLLVHHDPLGKVDRTEWAAITDTNGGFAFNGLNEGVYQVCPQAPQSAWLKPCAWASRPQAALSVAQPSASISLVMIRGAVVPIRVDDPGQLLSRNEGITRGAHLLLGIGHDPFMFEPATIVSRDAAGRNYQTVLPFNYPVKLVVFSSYFRLSSAVGAALPAAATTILLTVVPGQQPPMLRFVVSGGGSQ